MVISLIGYRGVGKSSVGAQLASRLGYDSVDADTEISARAGKPIPEIFAQEGEATFRRWEADVLADLMQGDQRVVSTGGGAVLHAATRERLQLAGPVIWLQATGETIWSRIGRSLGSGRPALTDLDPRAEVEELLRVRTPLYAEIATLTIPTDGRTVTAIVDEIESRLPRPPRCTEGLAVEG